MAKRKSKVSLDLKVTTNHVLIGIAALTAGVVIYRSAKAAKKVITEDLNPVSDQNVINRAVVNTFGQENVSSVADKIFAAIDLVNPFNESDAYARQVYGLDEPLTGGKNDK